jgi:large subunit ribosomal protein L23
MPDIYQIINKPIITEKGLGLNERGQYAFEVHPDANKVQIKQAIETLLTNSEGQPVKVVAVNTIMTRGKVKRTRAFGRASVGRRSDVKKAYVTVAPGTDIQLFEGV